MRNLKQPFSFSDAKSWRKRCRIMAGTSLVTYIPFIVLVAIFAWRLLFRKAQSLSLLARFRLLARHPPSFVLQSCTIFLSKSSTYLALDCDYNHNHNQQPQFWQFFLFPSHTIDGLHDHSFSLSFSLTQVILFHCQEKKNTFLTV